MVKKLTKKLLRPFGLYAPMQLKYRALLQNVAILRAKYALRKFKGFGFTCNFCGATYGRFVAHFPKIADATALKNNSVIAGYGENIYCPSCYSNARDRLVAAILDEQDLSGKSILHFAPEKHLFDFIRKRAPVITCDLVPELYRNVDKKIRKEDITDLSFADATFDWVIANHVLEHIPDDQKALQEIFRILKPGGRSVLQVPFSETLSETIEAPGIDDPARQSVLFGQRDHVRIYAANNYLSRLRNAGFDATVLPAADLEKYRRFATQPDEIFFDIRK